MLRITTRRAGKEVVMTLEGCLRSDWVSELEACWREAAQSPHGTSVRVDLADVCHVDDAGRALITAMLREGVQVAAKGCVLPELIRELAEAAAGGRRN